jgi:hypothetical protein
MGAILRLFFNLAPSVGKRPEIAPSLVSSFSREKRRQFYERSSEVFLPKGDVARQNPPNPRRSPRRGSARFGRRERMRVDQARLPSTGIDERWIRDE